MSGSNDPMAAVRQYVDAFNSGDAKAIAAMCADPMQIFDGMFGVREFGYNASSATASGRHISARGKAARMLDFICRTCGRFVLDEADCASFDRADEFTVRSTTALEQ